LASLICLLPADKNFPHCSKEQKPPKIAPNNFITLSKTSISGEKFQNRLNILLALKIIPLVLK